MPYGYTGKILHDLTGHYADIILYNIHRPTVTYPPTGIRSIAAHRRTIDLPGMGSTPM